MLSVWTGLPGSGKTSGVIEKVLVPLAAKGWIEHAVDADGNKVEVKRRLFTNINGLLLEHEKIDADDLLRWPEWVKPGDLIVFDEVQKPWPLTGANKEQPKCITELETHRHYGIDMHLLTQHPMLINAAIVRLAGQHFHVRKLGNSRFATIYEWDGVSRTLLYKNSFSKKPWHRSKKTEKVYRSSSLHTKQKRSMPTVLFTLLIAILGVGYLGPTVYARIQERSHPGAAQTGSNPVATGSAGVGKADSGPATASKPEGKGAGGSKDDDRPKVAGCAAIPTRCTCWDTDGLEIDPGPGYCKIKTGQLDSRPLNDLVHLVIPDQARHELELRSLEAPDTELIAFAAARDQAARLNSMGAGLVDQVKPGGARGGAEKTSSKP